MIYLDKAVWVKLLINSVPAVYWRVIRLEVEKPGYECGLCHQLSERSEQADRGFNFCMKQELSRLSRSKGTRIWNFFLMPSKCCVTPKSETDFSWSWFHITAMGTLHRANFYQIRASDGIESFYVCIRSLLSKISIIMMWDYSFFFYISL